MLILNMGMDMGIGMGVGMDMDMDMDDSRIHHILAHHRRRIITIHSRIMNRLIIIINAITIRIQALVNFNRIRDKLFE